MHRMFWAAVRAVVVCAAAGLMWQAVRPVQAIPATGFVSVQSGNQHTCALTAAGGVKCWGRNQFGQLGIGSFTPGNVGSVRPLPVLGLSSGVAAISTSGDFTCALTTGGGVKCWGRNANGQLGDFTQTDRAAPVDVINLTSGVLAVSAGDTHACALVTGGGAMCWGNNFYGQLGHGDDTNSWLGAVAVAGLSSGVAEIDAGGSSTCARMSAGGGVKCWGNNFSGQLGVGTLPSSAFTGVGHCPTSFQANLQCVSQPIDVPGLSAVQALGIDDTNCVLTSANGVKCWGFNAQGQAGNGTTSGSPNFGIASPVDVTGLTSGVSSLGTSAAANCARMASGGAKCWGGNDVGQVGDGTTTDRTTPVDVSGLTGGVTNVSGGRHSCARISTGGIKCWGGNSFGELGSGTASPSQFTPNPFPVDVTNDFVVNTTGDGGDIAPGDGLCDSDGTAGGEQCSLRAAIEEANALPGTDGIDFNIGSGAQTIAPGSPLPAITQPVVIDGRTQTGYAGAPLIELSGAGAGAAADGLTITGGGTTVRGLVINRFTGSGIVLSGGSGSTIAGNYIGTVASGNADAGNALSGIVIDGSSNNMVGGTVAADRNVISGNDVHGVAIFGPTASNNTVAGNYIGAGADGTTDVGNAFDGVKVGDGTGNVVGVTTGAETNGSCKGGCNLIFGNDRRGVSVGPATSAVNNRIQANAIYGNARLGIDIGSDGVTWNDPISATGFEDQDAGANNLMNYPDIVSAVNIAGHETIRGVIRTPNPTTVTVDVYATQDESATGLVQGQVWLGSTTPLADGTWSLQIPGATLFDRYTATATDVNGSTSEFTACPDPLDGAGDAGSPDDDADGLCDIWERYGIDADGDGLADLPLNAAPYSADPERKDLYVEADYMDCTLAGSVCAAPHAAPLNHAPANGAMADVAAAFAVAPVPNPDLTTGINLHISPDGANASQGYDEAVPELEPLRFNASAVAVAPAGTFDQLKNGSAALPCDGAFGTVAERTSPNCAVILAARKQAFRYAIFGHDHAHSPGSSGIAEIGGNDFFVSLGGANNASYQTLGGVGVGGNLTLGRRRMEAATFMHELGHTLNLGHGGNQFTTAFNYKPNYLSIMSYTFQFLGNVPNRPLDYSRWTLAPLNEFALNENLGIDNGAPPPDLAARWPSTAFTWWNGASCVFVGTATTGAIDWDNNGAIVAAVPAPYVGINDPAGPCNAGQNVALPGYSDWPDLQYDFKSDADAADGTAADAGDELETPMTAFVQQAQTTDFDKDGVVNASDNCAALPNAAQINTDLAPITLPKPKYSYNDVTVPDSDGWGDPCDDDDDNDGLTDAQEVAAAPCGSASATTDPLNADSDGDTYRDGAECALGFDPNSAASHPPYLPPVAVDADRDGLPDSFEASIGADPTKADTDGDAIADGVEFMFYGTRPDAVNSDGDVCSDAKEVASVNNDLIVSAADLGAIASAFGPKTAPNYVLDFDMNKDGVIVAGDLGWAATRFGAC